MSPNVDNTILPSFRRSSSDITVMTLFLTRSFKDANPATLFSTTFWSRQYWQHFADCITSSTLFWRSSTDITIPATSFLLHYVHGNFLSTTFVFKTFRQQRSFNDATPAIFFWIIYANGDVLLITWLSWSSVNDIFLTKFLQLHYLSNINPPTFFWSCFFNNATLGDITFTTFSLTTFPFKRRYQRHLADNITLATYFFIALRKCSFDHLL